MDSEWMVRGLIGGAIIGVSASLLLVANGRVAGVSGIASGLLSASHGERRWRVLFIGGLLVGGMIAAALLPDAFAAAPPSFAVAIASGLLVGAGTKLGNGCTSGHGVCGVSRVSKRSIIATATFIATGALTVIAMRAIGAAP